MPFDVVLKTVPCVVNRMTADLSLREGAAEDQIDGPLEYDRQIDGRHVDQGENSDPYQQSSEWKDGEDAVVER